jgi:small-conductance mechanosensitive channel
MMTTRIRTHNRIVTLPNSVLLSSSMVNHTVLADRGAVVSSTVGIGYDAPWRQVEAMLLAAASRTPGVRQSPEPYVLMPSLNQFDITYELNAYVDANASISSVKAELNRNILDQFNEYSVQIMTPAFEGNPDRPVLVPKAQWYAAPAAERARAGRD